MVREVLYACFSPSRNALWSTLVQLQLPVLAAADAGEAVASKSLPLRTVQIGGPLDGGLKILFEGCLEVVIVK